jgi:predicted nucleotidyltransferase
MMDLLKRRKERRMQRREELRMAARQRLKEALHQLAPGENVLLFGSVTRPYAFHQRSDVDIAFIEEPRSISRYALQARLEEMVRHPIDLVVLPECRFGRKIEREGEAWTN